MNIFLPEDLCSQLPKLSLRYENGLKTAIEYDTSDSMSFVLDVGEASPFAFGRVCLRSVNSSPLGWANYTSNLSYL